MYCLDFLHLLNMSCTCLFFQYAAFGLHFPVAHLNDLVAESCCNLFEGLVSRFTFNAVRTCIQQDRLQSSW